MPFVSLTRLRLRSWRYLPAFFWNTWKSMRQAQRASGFLEGQLARDPSGGFWTLTAWTDGAAMRAYRNTGAHMRVMPRLLGWCDEASVAHWEKENAGLPSAAEAFTRMQAEGRPSKVRHPSPAHSAGQVVPAGAPPVVARRFGPV